MELTTKQRATLRSMCNTLPVVLTIDGSDGRIAKAVASASGTAPGVDTLHAMQTITRQDIEAGASYLNIMQQNLQVLLKALQR